MAWNFKETLAMEPIPQTFKPMIEQWANKSFFTDRPIVGMRLERLAAEAQYEPWTSETMRLMGKAFSVSPKRAEAMLRGYLGTIGLYALSAADALVRGLGDYPEGVEKSMEDYPVLKSFYRGAGSPKNTRFVTSFYEMSRDVNQLYAAVLAYRRQGEPSAAERMIANNADKLKGRAAINKYRAAMSKINKRVRQIHYSRTMGMAEKRTEIDKLIARRNKIAETGVVRFGPNKPK
jgi:hypothetical protein